MYKIINPLSSTLGTVDYPPVYMQMSGTIKITTGPPPPVSIQPRPSWPILKKFPAGRADLGGQYWDVHITYTAPNSCCLYKV